MTDVTLGDENYHCCKQAIKKTVCALLENVFV